jgi:toxin ParE1/3/4
VADFILASCIEDELDKIWEFIAKDNPEAATRVVLAAYDTFRALAANPGLGHPYAFRRKAHRNVRARNTHGFDNYLIFYRETSDGIEVLHVYHNARNINRLMGKR